MGVGLHAHRDDGRDGHHRASGGAGRPELHPPGGEGERQGGARQIEMLGTALDTFRLDVGRYPTTQEGLAALRQRPFGVDRWDGPYLKKDTPRDPWDHPYYYRAPGEGGRPYDLLSYGADGGPGGDGDNRDITSYDGDTG